METTPGFPDTFAGFKSASVRTSSSSSLVCFLVFYIWMMNLLHDFYIFSL